MILAAKLVDWLNILDLEQAAKTVRTDIYGDWHRDPWDWAEHEWLLTESGRTYVLDALNDGGARRGSPLDVAKENFSTRPAFVFDPVDRLIYQALVDRLSVKLVGDMPRWSYSWRLARKNPRAGHYVDMSREWEGYRRRLINLSSIYDAALTTDIVSFFASIPMARLIDRIYEVCGPSAVTKRLESMLDTWADISNRGGLPMRANASSILASMYLNPLDDILISRGREMHSNSMPGGFWLSSGTALRWVDDVWLFGDGRADLRAAQLDIQEVIRSLGLQMNLAKTHVWEGDTLLREARNLEHSAVEVGLGEDSPDFGPLDLLLDRIMMEPETASHTSVRFATVRMRRHGRYDRTHEFIDVAPRMPHASQALARLFRSSKAYKDLGDWYTVSATLESEADPTLESEATGSSVSSLPGLGF